jgi:hypothetical protein
VKKATIPVPRIAVTPPEAAASLGVGPDYFDQHIAPELRVIRRGRKRLIAVVELERWALSNSDLPMEEQIQ